MLSILDGAFQSVIAFVIKQLPEFKNEIYLPHSFEKLQLLKPLSSEVIVQLDLIDLTNTCCQVDMKLFDLDEQLLCVVENYRAQKVSKKLLQKSDNSFEQENLLYKISWLKIDAQSFW